MTISSLRPLDVLLVRHAEAVAAGPVGPTDDERPLTEAGVSAADELADELEDFHVTAIYSSPSVRAVRTVAPLAQRRALQVHLLDDLRERRLATAPDPDWQAALERAWTDADYALPGGESGRAAQRRGVATLDLVRTRHPDGGRVVIGSHANLISLMLQALEPEVGFSFHMAMPTPAVYRLNHDGTRWRVVGGHGFTPLDP